MFCSVFYYRTFYVFLSKTEHFFKKKLFSPVRERPPRCLYEVALLHHPGVEYPLLSLLLCGGGHLATQPTEEGGLALLEEADQVVGLKERRLMAISRTILIFFITDPRSSFASFMGGKPFFCTTARRSLAT